LSLDDNVRADDRRIAGEPTVPEAVAQHGNAGLAARPVVVGGERAPDQRLHTQDREVLT